MSPLEIREHLRKQPFEPFRLHESDGSSFEVPHPDIAFVTSHTVVIGSRPDEDGLPLRSTYVDPIHITPIEPHTARKSKPSNGKKS